MADGLGERLRLLGGPESRESAGAKLGVHPNTLKKYEEEIRVPDADFIVKFCEVYGIGETWLLTGHGPVRRNGSVKQAVAEFLVRGVGEPSAGQRQVHPDEFAFIPVWGAEASSGFGSFVDVEAFGEQLAFSRAWLRTTHASAEKNLSVVFNRGDSNEPDIRHGDAMLVDRGIQTLKDNAFYVFDRDGMLLAKGIERTVSGHVILKSRNPRYADQTLSPEEAAAITLFGRVLWRGGVL